ncbi:cupin domain-containing protein [Pseudohoeflea suaedae]|uniref:Cupin domain-containing protein n=1 Tax=Pseudohoeflea suaedae TaxID=877384 RepID=A0A4R5PJ92_9HYPH|nr:cupin domain-containing protein [Pseudohoeflea suaedae]TDH34920.1 cupin domain-containing protein [Pseudohoeflea suaedae]
MTTSKQQKIVTISPEQILDGAPMQQEGGGVRDLKLVYPETGLGAQTLCMGLVEIDPGHASPMHRHNCEETYYVLDGQGELELEGERYPLVAGGCSLQRPNETHRVHNTGDKTLRLLVIGGVMLVPLWPKWPTETPYEVFEGSTKNAAA